MAGTVNVRFGAEIGDFVSALDKVNEQTAQSSAWQRRYAQDLEALGRSFSQLRSTLDPVYAAQAKLNGGLETAAAALKAGQVSAADYAKTVEQLQSAYGKAADGAMTAGHATAGATREMIVLGHEVISGNFSRIPGSMMVLAERSGNLHGIISGLVSPFGLVAIGATAVTAAFVAMAVQAEHSQAFLGQVNSALLATGNVSRISAEQVRRSVEQMREIPEVTREIAEETALSMARVPQVTGPAMEEITRLMGKFVAATGVDAPTAARTLASVLSDPDAAMKSLRGTVVELSAETQLNVESLVRQGDTARAAATIMAELETKLADVKDRGVTPLETAIKNLKDALDNLTSSPKIATFATGLIDQMSYAANAISGMFGSTRGQIDFLNEAIVRQKDRIKDVLAQIAAGHTPDHPLEGYIQRLKDLEARLEAAKLAQDTVDSVHHSTPGATPGKSTPTATSGGVDDEARVKKALDASTSMVGNAERLKQLEDERKQIAEALAVATGEQEKATLQLRLTEANKQISDLGKQTGGASNMETWRSELAQQDAAQNASRAEQLRNDIAFWQAKRANLQTGSRDAIEVDREIARNQISLHNEEISEAKRAAQEKREITKADADTDVAISKMQLETNKQLLDEGVAEHAISAQEKVQILRGLTEAAYQEDLKRLQDELATLKDLPKEYDRVYNEIRRLKAGHDQEMANLDRQAGQAQQKAADDNVKAWEKALSPISRAFSTSISGMIMGTQRLQQAEQRILQNIVASFVDAAQQMTTKWIASQLAQLTATETTNAGITASNTGAAATDAATQSMSILKHAGSAAAAVYDDVAQIPYVGWILAPPAAAAAFAAVAAFSAEGGWGNVPFDGAVTALHAQEMVLPSSIATPLRSAIAGGTFNTTNSSSTTASNSNISSAASINVNCATGSGMTQGQARMVANAVAVQWRNANSSLMAAFKSAR